MKCPYCGKEMNLGYIDQDRFPLKWVPEEYSTSVINSLPFVKGIKLTSLLTNSTVRTYYCKSCRKLVIDLDNLY